MRACFTAIQSIPYEITTMNFNETDEFAKAFKRLSKKYRSLPDDLLEFKKVITELPLGIGRHFVILHSQEEVKVLKARLFCKYLRGASLRIIYAYQESQPMIHFIELYFKGKQVNENRQLIKEFLSQFSR